MKPKRSNPLFAAFFRANALAGLVVVSLAAAPSARADQTYQDTNALNTWNLTDANWDDGVEWNEAENAIFGGTGETVTVDTVSPFDITFNSSGYVLTGGTIGLLGSPSNITANADATIASSFTGGFAKVGSGVLTISGANGSLTASSVSTGIVKLGSATALGNAAFTTASGATLDVAGFPSSASIILAGTGVGGNGALINSSATKAILRSLTLTADATIKTTSGAILLGSTTATGTLNLGGYTLTKAGSGVAIINGVTMSDGGNIKVAEGTLQIFDDYNPGSGSTQKAVTMAGTGTLKIMSGASVLIPRWSTALSMTMPVELNGGTLGSVWPGPNGATIASPISVTADSVLNFSGGYGTVNLSGALTGSSKLTRSGSETTTFSGDISGFTGTLSLGAAIAFNGAADQVFNGTLAGTSSFVKSGAKTATIAGNTTGSFSTTVSGGTLVLTGSNTNTGASTVTSGVLRLDYGTHNNSKISGNNLVTLSGGSIQFVANASAATTQSIKGLTLSNASSMLLGTAAGQTLTVDFTANGGALTRTTGTLDVTFTGSGTALLTIPGTTPNTANIPWITLNGSPAGTDAANHLRSAVPTSNQNDLSLWSSGSNTYYNSDVWINSVGSGVSINGFSFVAPVAATVVIGTGNTLTVKTITDSPLSGANASAVTGGTLQGPAAGVLTINQGNTSASLTIGSVIGDNGGSSLLKTGAGNLVLSGTNTYTGITTVSGGTLTISADASLGAAPATATAGSIALDGTVLTVSTNGVTINANRGLSLGAGGGTLNTPSANQTTTYLGAITGTGALTLAGTGDVSFGGTSTYTGGTTINSGRIVARSSSAFGTGTVTIASGGGVYTAAALTIPNDFIISGAGANSVDTTARGALRVDGSTFNGAITMAADSAIDSNSGTGILNGVISGAFNLTLNKNDAGTIVLAAANTYTGTTTINGGVIRASGSNSVFSTGAVSVTSSSTIGTAAGGGARSLANNISVSSSKTLTLDGLSGGSLTLTGIVSGAGALSSSTAGTIVLSNANTFTGGITLTGGGTLVLGTDTAAGVTGILNVSGITLLSSDGSPRTIANPVSLSGSTTFGSAGTGNLKFTGSVDSGSLAVTKTFTIANGTTEFAGPITNGTATATLAKNGSGTMIMSGANTTAKNITVSAGSLVISGSPTGASPITLAGGNLTLDYSTNNTSKISDATVLTLNGGSLTLAGATGTHTEVVASTTVGGVVSITRSGANTAKIALGAVTIASGAVLNVASAGLATTTNANNSGGYLSGITLAGALAANDGAGNIVAFVPAYTDINQMGGIIAGNAASNVRIVAGGTTGTVTVGAGTTDVNTLTSSSASGSTTVAIGTGNTLRVGANGAIIATTGSGGLAFTTPGTLTAGGADNTAGTLVLDNESTNPMTIGAVIANNGSAAVAVTKDGPGNVILTGANSASGGYTINAGTLQVGAAGITGTLGASTVVNNGNLTFSRIDATPQDLNGVISGPGSVTYQGSGVSNQSQYTVNDANTYSGGTTINNARATVSTATGFGTGPITITSGGTLYDATALTIANPLTIAGIGWTESTGNLGAIRAGAAVTFSGPLTLSANARLGSSSTASFTGAVSAPGLTIQSGAPSSNGGGSISGVVAFGNVSAITSSNTTIDVQSGTFRYDTGSANGSNLFATTATGGSIQAASGTTVSLYQTETNAYSTSRTFTMGPQITLNGATFTGGGSAGALSLRLLASTAIVANGSCTISETGGTQYNQIMTIEGPITGSGTLKLERALNVNRYLKLRGSQAGYTGNVTVSSVNTTGGYVIIADPSGWGSGTLTLDGAGSNLTVGDEPATNFGFTGNDLALGMTTGTFAPTGAITVGPAAQLMVNNRTGSAIVFEPQGALTVNGGTLAASGTDGTSAFAPAANATWVFGGTALSTVSANLQLTHAGATFQVADAIAGSGTDTVISGVISGANGFTKTGPGTLALAGANTYTGSTVVSAGTLALNGTSIADTGRLVINGGIVNLAASSNETVGTLYYGATQQPAGTYGSSSSSATFKDDTRFSGTGVLTVASSAGGYTTWAATNAGGQAANLDYDGDGVPNGVEYFMGKTGSSFTANPAPVNGVITWPKDPTATATYIVQTSPNLVTWTTAAGVVDNTTSVSYTLPTGSGKLFVRIKVTVP